MSLLETKVRQSFAEADEALALLDEAEDLPQRVLLAAVMLSQGSLESLRGYITSARVDWRDVIAWAEYPRELAAPPGEATDEMRVADRADYETWLQAE